MKCYTSFILYLLFAAIRLSSEEKFETQPTMGRLVQLGAVYYAKTERLAFDETLWTVANINANSTKQNITKSVSKVRFTKNLLEKFDHFDISAELSLSTLGGLIEITGSIGYLRSDGLVDETSNLALTYKSVISNEFISQDMRSKLDFYDVCESMYDKNNPATHIVSSITRGFMGTFDFDIKRQSSDTKQDISAGRLDITVAEILTGSVGADIEFTDAENRSNIICSFSGDTILKTIPTSIEEAKLAFKNLSQQAKGSRAIIQFSLTPISKYCGGDATKIINDISKKITERLIEIILELQQTVLETKLLFDLESSKFYTQELENPLKYFLDELEKFEMQWKSNLTRIRPKVKGNELPITALSDLIETYDKSAFNHEFATLFLQNRRREMRTVNIIIKKKYDGIVIEKASSGKGNECLFNDFCTIMFEFDIFPYKNIGETYIKNQTLNKYSEKHRWFWDREAVALGGKKYRKMVEFYLLNKRDKQCCLNMRLLNEKNESLIENKIDSKEISRTKLYKEGVLIQEDVVLPSQVEIAGDICVSHNRISFTMEYPNDPKDLSDEIILTYTEQNKGKIERKKSFALEDRQSDNIDVELDDLKSSVTYEIVMRAKSEYGLGPISKKNVTTNLFPPVPGLRVRNKDTNVFVNISWEAPEPNEASVSLDELKYTIYVEDKRKTEKKEKCGQLKRETDPFKTVKATYVELKGLKPANLYEITVTAEYRNTKEKNVVRYNRPSKIFVTTLPPQVKNLENTKCSYGDESHNACVRWTKPDISHVDPIVTPTISYLVRYCIKENNTMQCNNSAIKEQTAGTKHENITLQNLGAGLTYLVYVRMETNFAFDTIYGEGDYSSPINITTKPINESFYQELMRRLGINDLIKGINGI